MSDPITHDDEKNADSLTREDVRANEPRAEAAHEATNEAPDRAMAPEESEGSLDIDTGAIFEPHAMTKADFSAKPSTPWAEGSLHDFMHAKITVVDDVVFTGSFNLSRSGEQNAENVLEIEDAALAEQMATFIDEIRGKYAPVRLLGPGLAPASG